MYALESSNIRPTAGARVVKVTTLPHMDFELYQNVVCVCWDMSGMCWEFPALLARVIGESCLNNRCGVMVTTG